MRRVISFFKGIRVTRLFTVLFASIFLFVATACSPSNSVQAKGLETKDAGTKAYPEQYVPKNAVTNPREGGMNQFSDVDPRANTDAAEAKKNALIDKSERTLTNRTGNPAEAIKRVAKDAPDSPKEAGYSIKDKTENLGDKVKSSAEDFAAGTKRGVENIKGNTENAAADVKSGAKQAASNVKETGKDAAGTVKRAADKLSD